MARVFVVHNPNRLSRETGKLAPQHDCSDALRFGELVEVLPSPANPFMGLQLSVDQMHAALRCYDPTVDFLLLIGNPVFIGLCVAIAADYGGGDVNVLQWSGTQRAYIPTRVSNLFRAAD